MLLACGSAQVFHTIVEHGNALSFRDHLNQGLIAAQLIASVICDVLISGSMVYLLRLSKHHNSFKRTRSLIDRLITYSLGFGLITSVVSIINSALWLGLPVSNFSWAALHYITGKLYINSYLASLNARTQLTRRNETENLSSFMNEGRYALSDLGSGQTQPPAAGAIFDDKV
ncbi:hypothetical protein HGRIS_006764 [Hohenbuehelia grisea]|uniref:DUF6534 domain-containing protein n=1 Tax=Hohenbuehelia grisea TaxID=104357 RepID=A0ABR3J9Y5_9AGAR